MPSPGADNKMKPSPSHQDKSNALVYGFSKARKEGRREGGFNGDTDI